MINDDKDDEDSSSKSKNKQSQQSEQQQSKSSKGSKKKKSAEQQSLQPDSDSKDSKSSKGSKDGKKTNSSLASKTLGPNYHEKRNYHYARGMDGKDEVKSPTVQSNEVEIFQADSEGFYDARETPDPDFR